MIITHKLQSMDLTHKQNTSRVDIVQDDKYSRDVEFTLTENGVAWRIPDGTTAIVRYKKPDGTGGNYDTLPDGSTAYQINGNVLTVALAPQVCTVQGYVQLSVGLIQGNAEINTFSVNIVVHPNPGAEYQSEDYIKLSGAVPNSGWTPNMYLGTDASGNVVAKEGTSGGGGTVSIDSTLTKPGQAADAAAVGNRLSALSEEIAAIPSGADGKSAYQYAQDGGYTGTETEFAAKLAQEKFANPNALTFTGAVTGSYDGSAAVTVEIPSGGGGGITGFRRVVDTTLTEAAEIVNLTTDINGNTFSLSECYLFIEAACTEPDTITYIPNGYWTAGTYMISGSKTATDYPYIYIAYSCGGSDHFFGFELRHRTGVSMPNYNSNKSANWRPITSYKLAGKFAKGARFIIFGRDA